MIILIVRWHNNLVYALIKWSLNLVQLKSGGAKVLTSKTFLNEEGEKKLVLRFTMYWSEWPEIQSNQYH